MRAGWAGQLATMVLEKQKQRYSKHIIRCLPDRKWKWSPGRVREEPKHKQQAPKDN